MLHYAAYYHATEAIVSDFFPFIHEPEKKKVNNEPELLYIELIPPPPKTYKDDKKDTNPSIIIIQL